MRETTATPVAPVRARSRRRPAVGGRDLAAYLFVLPLTAVFALFYLWPAISTILSSFFSWGLLQPWRLTEPDSWDFVGFGNYQDALNDPDFWSAAVNTAIWLVAFPTLVTGFALLVSILIWYAGRGGGLYRSVFILPMTISLTAAGVIWSFIYNPDPSIGLLNAVTGLLGLGDTHLWLSDLGSIHLGGIEIRLVNLSLVVAAFWAFAGFGVITFTAGLASVSQELVEAARVDGARVSQIVRYVLLPALRRPLIVVVVVSVIFALRVFDIVFVMTQGGPVQDTMVLALLLWQDAFAFLDTPSAGLAAAIAVLLSAALVLGAYPYLRELTRSGSRR